MRKTQLLNDNGLIGFENNDEVSRLRRVKLEFDAAEFCLRRP